MEINKNIKQNPNKLPFLQAQILSKIYFDIYNHKQTTQIELSSLTNYPPESKILKDAINNLCAKGFLNGSLYDGFDIPENNKEILKKVIKFNDINNKKYKSNINFDDYTNQEYNNSLFSNEASISELNKIGCVHRWYNYLEEFPYSLTEEKIKEYNIKPNSLICDPFAGSGTTLISSNLFKCNAIGFDVNPLMTFISTVKTTFNLDLNLLKKTAEIIINEYVNKINIYQTLNQEFTSLPKSFLDYMPKKELNQWLSPILQKESYLLKIIVDKVEDKKIKNALYLSLAKATFDASYVSLCPGTTFYPFKEKQDFWDLFIEKATQIYSDLFEIQKFNHYGTSRLINDSCLLADKYIDNNSIDFIITSPPYPNDLEYTRQTRLELYLLDFVKTMDDVQKIKRNMVKGSTKLIFKESNSEKFISNFKSIKIVSDKIYEQTKDKNWGFDYPRMVREYFGDMYLTMKVFFNLLKNNSHFLLVVGDQTIKGVYIPVCDILIEMATNIGYKDCSKELFRIRRSTGHDVELPEEIVILRKN